MIDVYFHNGEDFEFCLSFYDEFAQNAVALNEFLLYQGKITKIVVRNE